MNIIVLDTETISLEKQFIYNLGWVVVDTETGEILETQDLVIDQIWQNKPIMTTAYYANKKPIYTKKMKGKHTTRTTWGRACQRLQKSIKQFKVSDGYAYNGRFDCKAFKFNHKFYNNKTRPLETIQMHDIMDYIYTIINNPNYERFCRANDFITAKGNLKKTAESVYAYLIDNGNYKEEHTALQDSLIEAHILLEALKRAPQVS